MNILCRVCLLEILPLSLDFLGLVFEPAFEVGGRVSQVDMRREIFQTGETVCAKLAAGKAQQTKVFVLMIFVTLFSVERVFTVKVEDED